MAEMDPTQLLLTLLAGVGLTSLPKLLKGMGPQQAQARGGAQAAPGGMPNAALLGPFLQLLQQSQGGVMPGQSGQADATPPAVPRFPTMAPVPSRVSPVIPRVVPSDVRLGGLGG